MSSTREATQDGKRKQVMDVHPEELMRQGSLEHLTRVELEQALQQAEAWAKEERRRKEAAEARAEQERQEKEQERRRKEAAEAQAEAAEARAKEERRQREAAKMATMLTQF
ncbi:hypothetical protein HK102_010952, partial [Quaeritorhiza haematococci]